MVDSPALTRRLLAWYDRSRRPLPWRSSRDPYLIWVSEVMLQQTTVLAVIPYYQRFIARFPTIEALAGAPIEEVLSVWSGLGYYRRARMLWQGARQVQALRGGLPRTAADLQLLPGIGPYTAAAIASIAFDEPVAVVDGNVIRVLTRLERIDGDPAVRKIRRQIEATAARLVDPQRPGDSNQALMELGALICTPRAPQCSSCPWQSDCTARRHDQAEMYPQKAPRPALTKIERVALWIESDKDQRFLLCRIPDRQVNAGLWEFPAADRSDLSVRIGPVVATVKHTITRYRISVTLQSAELEQPTRVPDDCRWVSIGEAQLLGLTSATRKLLSQLGRATQSDLSELPAQVADRVDPSRVRQQTES